MAREWSQRNFCPLAPEGLDSWMVSRAQKKAGLPKKRVEKKNWGEISHKFLSKLG